MIEVPPEQRMRARIALHKSDVDLEADCDLDFFIAGGPGGQHRNKTESGVRLLHRPTGVVVTAVERRSQFQNRAMALVRLREKLYALTHVPKPRRPTKVSRTQKAQRLEGKRRNAAKKRDRRGDRED
jgi:protein subunit release factor B